MYLAAIVLVGCKGDSSRGKSQRIIPQKMRILHINGMTPVKNQGRGSGLTPCLQPSRPHISRWATR